MRKVNASAGLEETLPHPVAQSFFEAPAAQDWVQEQGIGSPK